MNKKPTTESMVLGFLFTISISSHGISTMGKGGLGLDKYESKHTQPIIELVLLKQASFISVSSLQFYVLLDQFEPWLLGKEHEKRITVKLVIQVRMRKFQQKLVAGFG